jgi:hypothetical protein
LVADAGEIDSLCTEDFTAIPGLFTFHSFQNSEDDAEIRLFLFCEWILITLNGKFLQGVPPIEVYRASIG